MSLGLNCNIEDSLTNSVVSKASNDTNLNILKLAIEKNPRALNIPGTDGWYPIHNTVFFGSEEQLKFLLISGVKLEALTAAYQTILHVAVLSNKLQTVKEIYKLYPDALNIQTKSGNTPLHNALMKNFMDIAEFLCEQGADINLKNNDGQGLAELAKFYNSTPMYELLKKYKK